MGNAITQKLAELEEKSSIISPNETERAQLFQPFQQLTEHFLNNLREETTFRNQRAKKDLYTLSGEPQPIEETINTLNNDLLKKGINAASGGHIGYIPGGGIYLSAIGDYMASISNAYAGVYYASPGAVEMEHACLNWVKSIFGFPTSAVGNLTSGGSIANMIGIAAARDHQKIIENGPKNSVIYLTSHTHHSVAKAIKILGLTQIQIRAIPVDKNNRMEVSQLAQQIKEDKAAGLFPSIVIASAGTTDTGAIDPINAIADICNQHNLWLHIDAAYGGFFILTDSVKDKFKGIERADSLVCDPHKSLFLPYGSGCVLVKDKEAVFASHRVSANYMQDTLEEEFPIDPSDVSPELTKHFRALRMWLPLKTYGVAPFRAALEEKLLLTQYFREEITKLGFQVGPTPDLSVTYFWYPKEKQEDEYNKAIMQECHKDGRVFLSSSIIDNRFVIRLAVLSFRTHRYEIDKTIAMVKAAKEKIEK